MKIYLYIGYFALLILLLISIASISAEEVYKIDGRIYHQRVFGFTLELPEGWMVSDDGSVSPSGDYRIAFGPDIPSQTALYIIFLPVKGLTLLEFINENLADFQVSQNIQIKQSKIGNIECYICRQSMDLTKSSLFPDLTNIFARIGDHFMHAVIYSYEEAERNKILDVLNTIRCDKSLIEVSFLAVGNRYRYGVPIFNEQNTQLYVLSEDPEIRADVSNSDGSENIIFDDLTYPARFPQGEHRDLNGYRRQFYNDGRYHVDNRGKRIDVYIPDIRVNASDFKLSVDIRFEGGHPLKGNGVVFKGCQNGFYLFEVTQDSHYALYRFSGDFETIIPKTFSAYINPYEDNRVEVQVSKNFMTFSINGVNMRRILIEDDFNSGFVGFYVCAGSWASFDNYFLEIQK